MKKIKLTHGKFALVDDEDFKELSKYNWHLTSHNYAVNSTTKMYLHRIVNKTPKGGLTDHINRNTLDNRKENLRTADKRINSINRGLQANNTSGYKGVSWSKKEKKWETYIWVNQKKIPLGRFNLLKDAVSARKQAELKYHEI